MLELDEKVQGGKEFGEIPVKLRAEYVYAEHAIRLSGAFSTEIPAVCARCLDDMSYSMTVDFSEIFRKEPDTEEEYPIEGDEIILDRMLIDQIYLNLPSRFLCKPDCKGLCPQCGANLNQGQCSCKPEEEQAQMNPFAKLKGLFDENEEV